MTTFPEVLSQLKSMAQNPRDQGTLFENLMATVLPQHPEYAFEKVWHWNDWPEREQLTGQDGKDIGIDLVGVLKDGNYCAIQCKFYDPASTIQKADLDSFFTESGKEPFASRLIITTTDKWSSNAEKAPKGQQIDTNTMRFSDLAESNIDWDIKQPARTRVHKIPKQLWKHQQKAVTAVLEGLEHEERGQMIMACGTGKTLTALHIAEQQVPDGGHILFLVPSLALMSQTLREWQWESKREHRYLAVCSDAQVGARTEDMAAADLSSPVTTNAQRIFQELSREAKMRGGG